MKKLNLLLLICLCGCQNVKNDNSLFVPEVDDNKLVNYEDFNNYYEHSNRKAMDESVLGAIESPDPFIMRFDGKYYLYATTGGSYIKCYESDDLVNFTPCDNGVLASGICYDYSIDSNAPDSYIPYAPEVRYYDGYFYLITSPLGNGHYILKSESPTGPYFAITDNLGRNIDGTFFIDSDESIYIYGANSGGIKLYQIDDDFTNFAFLEKTIFNAEVGKWNEGPYMLKRYGDYYLTYCGCHYLSQDYRVDYCYLPSGDVTSTKSYLRKDTLVVGEDDFNGLGHSCTFLGRDLDSYYLAYHNLESYGRGLNISRLAFNGSRMVADGVTSGTHYQLCSPDFETYGLSDFVLDGDYYLSKNKTSDTFSVEYNVIGNGKMIFSYLDANNYSYLEYLNNKITINEIKDNNINVINTINLNHQYANDVLHTFRFQNKDGLINLYFDDIEKLTNFNYKFSGGNIGFIKDNNFAEISYVAFSNVANGSSDKKIYSENISLATQYNEDLSIISSLSGLKEIEEAESENVDDYSSNLVLARNNDRATFNMYANEDNNYNIYATFDCNSLNAKVGLKIDDGEIITCNTINKISDHYGDFKCKLASINLKEGPHHISLVNIGDKFGFNKIEYLKDEKDIKPQLYLNNANIEENDDGYLFDCNLGLGALILKHQDEIAIDVDILNDCSKSDFISLLFNTKYFSFNYQGDADGINDKTFRGIKYSINKKYIIIDYIDFNYQSTLYIGENDLSSFNMKIKQEENKFIFYLNDKVICTHYSNLMNLDGNVGIMANGIKANVSIY